MESRAPQTSKKVPPPQGLKHTFSLEDFQSQCIGNQPSCRYLVKCCSHCEVGQSEGNHIGVLLHWHLPWGDIPGVWAHWLLQWPLDSPGSVCRYLSTARACSTLTASPTSAPFPSPLAKSPLCSRDLGCSCLHRHTQAMQLLADLCLGSHHFSVLLLLFNLKQNLKKTKKKKAKRKKPHFQAWHKYFHFLHPPPACLPGLLPQPSRVYLTQSWSGSFIGSVFFGSQTKVLTQP